MDITVQQVELLSDDDYIYLDVRGEIAYQAWTYTEAYEWLVISLTSRNSQRIRG